MCPEASSRDSRKKPFERGGWWKIHDALYMLGDDDSVRIQQPTQRRPWQAVVKSELLIPQRSVDP